MKLRSNWAQRTLNMPYIVNTEALKDEDHIVVPTPDEVIDPVRKMAKTGTGARVMAKSKSKSTNKRGVAGHDLHARRHGENCTFDESSTHPCMTVLL